MIISTQEPTISTALLNLCSVTIVHRFTSPEWLRILHQHLAGAADHPFVAQRESDGNDNRPQSLFDQIVELRVGEALLFAPSAIVGVSYHDKDHGIFERLGNGNLHVKVRHRLTSDGGRTVLSL